MWMCAVSVEWDCRGRVLTITDILQQGRLDQSQTPHTTAGNTIKRLYNTPLHPYYSGGIIKLLNCRHKWSCAGRSGQKGVESFPCTEVWLHI